MKVGILSDTHNNLPNLHEALERLRAQGIETVFHLGDITRPETIQEMHGFRVIHLVGNGDYLSGEIRRVLLEMNPENYSGLVWTGELGGVSMAATHGHLPGKFDQLVEFGQYAYVLKGHSHRRLDETRAETRLLNPGALGGLNPQERSFLILDLDTGEAQFVKL